MSGFFVILACVFFVINLLGFFYLNRQIVTNKQNLEQWKSEQTKIPNTKSMKQEPKKDELKKHLDDLFKVATKDFLLLEDDERVFLKDILYFTDKTEFVEVQMEKSSSITKYSFDYLAKRLPPIFVNYGDNYIVNQNWIGATDEANNELYFKNGLTLTK